MIFLFLSLSLLSYGVDSPENSDGRKREIFLDRGLESEVVEMEICMSEELGRWIRFASGRQLVYCEISIAKSPENGSVTRLIGQIVFSVL